MESYRHILKQHEEKNAPLLLSKHKLICRQMQYKDSAALYLAKPHWTNRFDSERDSTVGIFFTIWVSPELVEQKQFAYNIHSKQIRKLPGFRLASRTFAESFRSAVESRVSNWPGIRLDYGPVTLLEGRETCGMDTFADEVAHRITDFVSIHEEIDKLLDAAAV